jgi:hypothetical protein
MDKDNPPILYLYILRNLKKASQNNIIGLCDALHSLRKVVHTAPKIVLSGIVEELIEMELLIKNDKFFMIKDNKKINKKMERLKDYVFPLAVPN